MPQFPIMGFYEERPPRHGHRTPAELAEDETLSALHGDFCGMPEAPEERGPTKKTACAHTSHVSLLPWADAHPFLPPSVKQSYGAGIDPISADGPRPHRNQRRNASHDNDDN